MRNQERSVILILFALIASLLVCLFLNSSPSIASGTAGYITTGKTNVYFRDAPAGNPIQDNGSNIMLNGGQELTIIDTSNSSWYKVTLVYNGTTYTGYVYSAYITVGTQSTTSTTTTTTTSTSSDAEFEAYLTDQGFPESYKTLLRTLHASHPNWVFKAVKTGLDWSTVVANEVNKTGQIKNLVQCTTSSPHYNWRSTTVGYNISTDTWSAYDGTTWFAASDALVTYYLDPRVYLYEKYVFAFETLTYDSSHTESGVESILSGTFMSNTTPSGETSTYGQLIMQAAQASGVSAYHIASRIKQEVGTTIGTVTSGTNSTYPGIYNFYNIGGYDSSEGAAATNALKWAATGTTYGRPWNTVYKSIYGGALYIGNNYILAGQNTIYTEKFNVTNTSNLYNHQYMTNVQAVATEAAKVYTAYSSSGTLNDTITFSIPVYENMPDSVTTKPSDSGNPNNYLKTLSVSGYTLSPTFAINTTTSYSLIVAESVSSVTISATTCNSNASVSGTGTVSLIKGTNTIKLVVTAQSGATRTYTLTIVRGSASSSSSTSTASYSGSYTISDTYVTGVSPSTTVTSFISNLGASSGATVSVTDSSGTAKTSGKVGTGDKVVVTTSSNTSTYTILIYGDVNGDGQVTALDLLKVQKHIIGSKTLSGAYATAADAKKNGGVTAIDLLAIQKHITGASTISQ